VEGSRDVKLLWWIYMR